MQVMNDIIRKSHTGEAGNRGEFGTHTRSDGDVTLTLPGTGQALPAVTRDLPISWYAMELPTKRHRKPVPVLHEDTHPVAIRTVAVEDAPTSFEHVTPTGLTRTVRVIDGELYENVPYNGVAAHGDEERAFTVAGRDAAGTKFKDHVEPRESVEARMDAAAKKFVIIDGQTWKKATEPVYVVQEANRQVPGVHISIEEAPNNGYMAPDSYYPADQLDRAKQHARSLAGEWRDEAAFTARMDATPTIDIDPATYQPGTSWKQGRQLQYTRPEDTTPETLVESYKEFLTALEEVPTAVQVGHDGKPRVNRFGLSKVQLADYEGFLRLGLKTGLI